MPRWVSGAVLPAGEISKRTVTKAKRTIHVRHPLRCTDLLIFTAKPAAKSIESELSQAADGQTAWAYTAFFFFSKASYTAYDMHAMAAQHTETEEEHMIDRWMPPTDSE